MKVGLYNSCFENRLAADISISVLANTFALSHDTEIIRLQTSPTAQDLAGSSGCSLERVSFRLVDPPPSTTTDPNQPDHRYQALWDWSYELTRSYDLFINFADRLPMYSASPRSVLVIQFPYDFVPSFYGWAWQSHLHSYQLKLVNSFYTRFWTNVFWELDCDVVHPPLPPLKNTRKKRKLIVATGPFDVLDPEPQSKLISLFRDLTSQLPGWSLAITGNIDKRAARRKALGGFQQAAADAGVLVVTNPTFKEQHALFEEGSILWQATSFNHIDREPHKAEPFSLRVLQAMSTGCIPLVMNSGGFPELISHGETGLFWKQLDELAHYTILLSNDHWIRSRFAKAARKRSRNFRADHYVQTFLRHVENAFDVRSLYKPGSAPWWRRLAGPHTSSSDSAQQ